MARDTITRLRNLFNASCDLLDGESPIHMALVLLVVANYEERGEELDVNGIVAETGLSSSSASRNLAALGEWHRLQREGLKLVTLKTDLRDRRRKLAVLTTKGRRFVEQLQGIILE